MNDEFYVSKNDYKKIIKEAGNILTKSTGELVPTKYVKNHYLEFNEFLNSLGSIIKKQKVLTSNTLPKDFKFKQKSSLGNEFAQILGASDLDNLVSTAYKFSNTNNFFQKYIDDPKYIKSKRENIHEIIFELDKQNKLDMVSEFEKSYGESIYGFLQLSFELTKNLAYILKPRKRILKKTITKFMDVYRNEISAYVEFLIIYLYGIYCILRKDFLPYYKISRMPISYLVKELRKDPLFVNVVASYDGRLRNSLIHGGYHLDPASNKVVLTHKKTIEIRYNVFVIHIQNMIKEALFVANFTSEINYLRLRKMNEIFKKLQN